MLRRLRTLGIDRRDRQFPSRAPGDALHPDGFHAARVDLRGSIRRHHRADQGPPAAYRDLHLLRRRSSGMGARLRDVDRLRRRGGRAHAAAARRHHASHLYQRHDGTAQRRDAPPPGRYRHCAIDGDRTRPDRVGQAPIDDAGLPCRRAVPADGRSPAWRPRGASSGFQAGGDSSRRSCARRSR